MGATNLHQSDGLRAHEASAMPIRGAAQCVESVTSLGGCVGEEGGLDTKVVKTGDAKKAHE